MLLKSLEIQGFKTFPDKTKLTFDKGMTAVVGPNGSGKSNISDAIRWVLGEQSPKSLRCSKMEDVVFNGTDGRKRQGFAEVTLNIENKDRLLPFDGDTVAVTRRYYRSGESEYLINKASVRLKDINELFMDTGLGRDGYSMISQGKIDSIVASKSEDRREIFEEAAGISRYRYRKSEAERKLKNTEDNLLRLKDIVSDLEERIGPLKTQSEKAQRFLEFSKEKQGLEIAIWLDTLSKSKNMLKDQEDKIVVARTQHEDADSQLLKIQEESEKIYLENGQYASKIDEIRRKISEYEVDLNSKKSSVSVAENDILHNTENIERLKAEIEQLDSSYLDIQREIEEKERKISSFKSSIDEKQLLYNSVSEDLNNINLTSGKSGDELQSLTAQLSQLSEKSADLKVTAVTSKTSLEELSQRETVLNQNKAEKERELDDLKSIKNSYIEKKNELEKKSEQISNSIKGLEIKLSSRQKKRDELKQQADRLMLDTREKERRAKLLEDLERNLEGFSHSVKAIMNAYKHGRVGGIHGPVSRVIKVPDKYTVAVETALGAAMQNIVTETEEDAKRAIAFLKQNDGGRATFLPVNTIKGKELNEKGLEGRNGFVGIACDLCSCKDEYKNILSSLLGRIVVAENLNSAVNIAKSYNYRFKIVTLDGQVVNAGGSLTGGSLGRKSGLLSRTAEIEKIRKSAQELQQQYKNTQTEFEKASAEFSKCEADILGFKADLSNLKQEYIRVVTELKACENEISGAESAVNSIETELKSIKEKAVEFNNSSKNANSQLEILNAKILEIDKKISVLSGDRAKLTEQREELSLKLQNIKLEIVTAQKDVDVLNSEIMFAKSNSESKDNKKAEIVKQIDEYVKLNDYTRTKITSLKKEIELICNSIDRSNKSIENINSDREDLEKRTAQLRQLEREKTSDREFIGRELARLEERKINLQKQYDDITAKLWEEYELTVRQAQETAIEIDDINAGQRRLNELKQKIKSLGNINVSSIEEYKEVSERYEFMSTQVEDVEKSKKEIERLILDLTKKMREVFVESFNQINANFTYTFKELFGGGTASLSLSDPENILTSGIDIIVHPPGKIVVHLDALSGGEKALVAIALYFAIMKVRPAPFCVMDEIEAALDDVNVDRFAQYVRRMTDKTQFILITHRRGTMEEADVLYGVTMQDEGISKLLELRASEVAQKLGIKSR
ncbi:MAG: chromosome segregation protein SMC [Oscillospiraceae bacterium]|nr:chromosome segregation protein SMC [Oscillospiraceae bacterium]